MILKTVFVLVVFLVKGRVGVDIEFYLNVTEIIEYYGYPVEVHNVVTEDGFILELHRIPGARYNLDPPSLDNAPKPIIFLQHGFLCSSYDWIANHPHQSAAFIFADQGFDVWMGNFRGNTYSRKHLTLNPEVDKQFWEWSWDQLALYDLGSMIEKVLSVTRQDSLNYVGHSMGTLTMFSKLSTNSTFSKKIKNFFALAPIGTIHSVRGIFSFAGRHFGYDYENYNERYGPQELLGNSWLWKKVVKNTCGLFDTLEELCSDAVILFVGPLNNYWNQTRVPVYLAHTPAGSSSYVMSHFNQMYSYGGVPYFDMGIEKNEQVYGRKIPPQYDFSEIRNVPIHLFWSENDWLSTQEDLKAYLLEKLPPDVLKSVNHIESYNHLDFLWGTNAAVDIYSPIVKIIKNEEVL